jgi:hypothetical protein
MNSALPYWIQVLQALLTPAIAGAVAVIALFQWRTAQQKVVLDLFNRRMETYTALRKIVTKIRGSSSAATTEISFEFLRAMDRAEFLFGDEIVEHLKRIDAAINEIRIVLAERNGLQGPELTAFVAAIKRGERWAILKHIEQRMWMQHRGGWRARPYEAAVGGAQSAASGASDLPPVQLIVRFVKPDPSKRPLLP